MDAVISVGAIYHGGPMSNCRDATDANDDGTFEITDSVYLLSYFLLGGSPPPHPFPSAGDDPTEDGLDCHREGTTPSDLDPTVVLSIPEATVCEGWTFAVPVVMTSEGSVRAFTFGIAHDPAVVELVEVVAQEGQSAVVDGGAAMLPIDVPDEPYPSGAVTLCELHYRTVGAVGSSSPIEFTGDLGLDVDGPPLSVRVLKEWTEVVPATIPGRITVTEGGLQAAMDMNQDGTFDMSDAIALLDHLFLGNPKWKTLPCDGGTSSQPAHGARTLLDINGSGVIDISDPIHALSYLFIGGPPPNPPLPLPGQCTRIAGCPDVCTPKSAGTASTCRGSWPAPPHRRSP
jgi:hypothetical protein